MKDLNFKEMQDIQSELQEKYKNKWGGLYPEKGRDMLLWAFIEAGEAADIIKKHGDGAIINDAEVRRNFTEELCDILMYLNDVMLCYSITPEELREIYLEKHDRNMKRW
jgi:NTP pyrophosphatase (non-canonical NTP hydrolase)